MTNETLPIIGQRFRGFLPVVVDVETAGFNAQTDALLEIAAIPIIYNEEGQFVPGPGQQPGRDTGVPQAGEFHPLQKPP